MVICWSFYLSKKWENFPHLSHVLLSLKTDLREREREEGIRYHPNKFSLHVCIWINPWRRGIKEVRIKSWIITIIFILLGNFRFCAKYGVSYLDCSLSYVRVLRDKWIFACVCKNLLILLNACLIWNDRVWNELAYVDLLCGNHDKHDMTSSWYLQFCFE